MSNRKCNVCGKPAKENVHNLLCEEHYNDYYSSYYADKYKKKKQKVLDYYHRTCAYCNKTYDDLRIEGTDPINNEPAWKLFASGSYKSIEESLPYFSLVCEDCYKKKRQESGQGWQHGTLSGYRHCKCDACKAAKNAYQKEYKKKQKDVLKNLTKEQLVELEKEKRAKKEQQEEEKKRKEQKKYENSFGFNYPQAIQDWSDENEFTPFSLSKKSNKKVQWECSQCHHEWTASPFEVVRKITRYGLNGCEKCIEQYKKKKQYETSVANTHPELAKLFSTQNTIQADEVSLGTDKKIYITLPCGHDKLVRLRYIVQKDGSYKFPQCSQCVSEEKSLALKHPKLRSQYSDDNEKSFDTLTYNSAYKATWECENNHTWEATIYQRINGETGCPECSCNGVSQKEEDLYTYIRSILPEEEIVIRNDKTILDGKEIDILIENRHIGIEFNGLYWHGENKGKDRNYHKNKYLAAKKRGIQLITIWEDDWDNHQDVIKSMLKHKLGVDVSRRIYARKTYINEVDKKTAQEFMDKYHIQGYVQGSYYVGLYDKNETLVALSIWKRNGTTLYLDRYATSCTVVGGMGKLLKYAIAHAEEWKFDEIVTFSDHEVSDGGLYETLGFDKDKELKPDYKYVVDKQRIHKFNYRRKRFRDDPGLIYVEDLSESEMARLNGIDRVWDCGKTRWIKRIKNNSK